MATAQRFEDLHVWQDARFLVKEIYGLTKERGFARDMALKEQMARAAVSTMSNIAEGFERASRREFVHALNIAKASNGEVRSQLYVALDQGHINSAQFQQVKESAVTLSRRLSKFIDYLEALPNNSRRTTRAER